MALIAVFPDFSVLSACWTGLKNPLKIHSGFIKICSGFVKDSLKTEFCLIFRLKTILSDIIQTKMRFISKI